LEEENGDVPLVAQLNELRALARRLAEEHTFCANPIS
jgi:hypothetical protein